MPVVVRSVTLLLQNDYNIFATTLDGNDRTYLTSDGSPDTINTLASWWADGSRIVYTKVTLTDPQAIGGVLLPVGHIWSMNADGSHERELTFGLTYGALPSFSPDGNSILFTGYATGNPELWMMNIDGTNPHSLTHTTGSGSAIDGVELKYSSHGSYSPTGTKIAYTSTQSGTLEIWVMDSDGSDPIQITFPDDPNAPDAHNATWSPDGGKIVHYGGFARDHGYIYTMNPDGSDRTQLTSQYPSDDPSWSPDGQYIFYDILRDGQTEAWIMNRDGTDQRMLSTTPVRPKSGSGHYEAGDNNGLGRYDRGPANRILFSGCNPAQFGDGAPGNIDRYIGWFRHCRKR